MMLKEWIVLHLGPKFLFEKEKENNGTQVFNEKINYNFMNWRLWGCEIQVSKSAKNGWK